ncbi:hypothetical protein Q4575_06605 [Psychrosphaera sp. 1_MG-2023]|uniref:hypothetical protein n=1 Tax=Psychrosphaera sp. 1_MG-2023 TaxID=3062643 RepID=UPI0026E44766|nr:hypothetical protein [Psychrosphaera sp. 1_MG-2023]MDO6719065.1 hypothetical protein [Psychrosphaera sp. 1_MG-2023]
MKTKIKTKSLFNTVLLIGGLVLSSTAHANLINGDFGDDLNGWSGDVFNYANTINGEWETDINFDNYQDNYSTVGNSVILTTDFDIAEVYLYQDFTFGNNVSELSLSFSSSSIDEFSLVLFDGFGFYHDFVTDGSVADVSSLSGQNVSLEFALWDFDLIDDTLTVSDISISALPVPEPSSFAIFIMGLFVLRQKASALNNRISKG